MHYAICKIDLFEGRTQEQKVELAREVTELYHVSQKLLKKLFTFSLTICLKDLLPTRRNEKKKLIIISSHFCGCFILKTGGTPALLS